MGVSWRCHLVAAFEVKEEISVFVALAGQRASWQAFIHMRAREQETTPTRRQGGVKSPCSALIP